MKLSNDPEYIAWLAENKKPHGSARMLEFRGEIKSVKQWCSLLGLKTNTVIQRLKRGYSVEEALTISANRTNQHQ